jgi:hypothetical protein
MSYRTSSQAQVNSARSRAICGALVVLVPLQCVGSIGGLGKSMTKQPTLLCLGTFAPPARLSSLRGVSGDDKLTTPWWIRLGGSVRSQYV